MPYLTPVELRDATSNQELAQVATPREVRPITAADMAAVIDGSGAIVDPVNAGKALAKIEKAIADSSDLVDNFLRGRYPLPLPSTPRTVSEIMVRVVRYALHNERASEEITARYKEAMTWLSMIGAGKMQLEVPAEVVVNTGDAVYECGSELYSVDGLANYACPYQRFPSTR